MRAIGQYQAIQPKTSRPASTRPAKTEKIRKQRPFQTAGPSTCKAGQPVILSGVLRLKLMPGLLHYKSAGLLFEHLVAFRVTRHAHFNLCEACWLLQPRAGPESGRSPIRLPMAFESRRPRPGWTLRKAFRRLSHSCSPIPDKNKGRRLQAFRDEKGWNGRT